MSLLFSPKTAVPATSIDSNGRFLFAHAPHRIGVVTLVVRDLASVSAFYRTALGLEVVDSSAGIERLGVGINALIELRHQPDAQPQSRRDAGLFHTAFLLPSREDLGSWLRFAAEMRLHIQGAADHLVSEAVYISDPEGNGIEIYADRSVAQWPGHEGGTVEMANNPLDKDGLMAAAVDRPWAGFPEGGIVGHVHLQVGDLSKADGFYSTLLGFDVSVRRPAASFYGSGGYHHQLAGNIWNSRGAGLRTPGLTGLAGFELLTPDHTVVDATRERSAAAGHAFTNIDDGIQIRDPWGVLVTLKTRSV